MGSSTGVSDSNDWCTFLMTSHPQTSSASGSQGAGVWRRMGEETAVKAQVTGSHLQSV